VNTTSQIQPAGWGKDGSLFVAARVAEGAAGPSATAARSEMVLERLPPGGKGFMRVAVIPANAITMSVNAAGTLASCTARRFAPDVWLADRAGRSGW
jgi:hypothetical protein